MGPVSAADADPMSSPSPAGVSGGTPSPQLAVTTHNDTATDRRAHWTFIVFLPPEARSRVNRALQMMPLPVKQYHWEVHGWQRQIAMKVIFRRAERLIGTFER